MDMGGHMQMSAASLSSFSLWGAFLLGLAGRVRTLPRDVRAVRGCREPRRRHRLWRGGRRPWRRASQRRLPARVPPRAARTYALLGAVLGLLGEAGALATLGGPFSPTAITQWLKVVAGVLMLAMGVAMLVAWIRGRRANLPEPTAWVASLPWFGRAVARLSRSGGWAGLPLGALMGLLPCAPLLPVELAALATGKPLYGMLVMLAFGLGTVPALAGFGAASGLLGARARGWFAPVAAAAVVVLGAVTLGAGARARERAVGAA